MTTTGQLPPLLLAIIKPAVAYSPAGLAQLLGRRRRAVDQALRRMASTRQIGCRRIEGGVLYFRSQADADAFAAQEEAAFAALQRKQRTAKLQGSQRRPNALSAAQLNQVVKQRPGMPAPVVIAAAPKVERPVDMSRAVWTIAPAPLCRFGVDPASIVPGAFVTDMPAGRWSDYAVQGAA